MEDDNNKKKSALGGLKFKEVDRQKLLDEDTTQIYDAAYSVIEESRNAESDAKQKQTGLDMDIDKILDSDVNDRKEQIRKLQEQNDIEELKKKQLQEQHVQHTETITNESKKRDATRKEMREVRAEQVDKRESLDPTRMERLTLFPTPPDINTPEENDDGGSGGGGEQLTISSTKGKRNANHTHYTPRDKGDRPPRGDLGGSIPFGGGLGIGEGQDSFMGGGGVSGLNNRGSELNSMGGGGLNNLGSMDGGGKCLLFILSV